MRRSREQFGLFWGAFMTIVYIGIAYLIYFTPFLLRYNQSNNPAEDRFAVLRTILAIVFLLYGIARGYRTYRAWKTKDKRNE